MGEPLAEGVDPVAGGLLQRARQVLASGDLESAEQLLSEAEQGLTNVGESPSRSRSLMLVLLEQAELARTMSDLSRSESRLREALAISLGMDDPATAAGIYERLSQLARAREDWDAAEELTRASLRGFVDIGNLSDASNSYLILSEIARERGNPGEAHRLFNRAKEILGADTDRPSVVHTSRSPGPVQANRPLASEAVTSDRTIESRDPANPGAEVREATHSSSPGLTFDLRRAAQEILSLSLSISEARGEVEPTGLDVVLACLVQPEYTTLNRDELARGATAAMRRAVPAPAESRVSAALRVANADRLTPRSNLRLDDQRLAKTLSGAHRVTGLAGATEVWAHHVAASGLVDGRLPEAVANALGVDEVVLRAALRKAIHEMWPEESGAAWDSILGPLPYLKTSLPFELIYSIDTLGSQGLLGLAILVNDHTALTVSHVVSGFPFVALESLSQKSSVQAAVPDARTADKSSRIAQLDLLEPEPWLSAAFKGLLIDPEPKATIELLALDRQGNVVTLRGVIASDTTGELLVKLSQTAPGLIVAGGPVVSGGRLVGMAAASSNDDLTVVPVIEFAHLLDQSVLDEPAETALLFTEAAQTVLASANFVHDGRSDPVSWAEVLLGALGAAFTGVASPELSAMWECIPGEVARRSNRLHAALAAIGSKAQFPHIVSPDHSEAFLPSVLSNASVSEAVGSGPVDVRHVLGALLAEIGDLPPAVGEALEVTTNDLRRALRPVVFLAAAEAAEPQGAWDELLALTEPTLGGTIDSDIVVWDESHRLTDHLDVENYVNMLAVLVAAHDTPLPLSIGLFGPWGSGKTYFMGLMRQAIQRLADDALADREAGRAPISCARVVPITFNAWHYADANLWASLAVRIFDELAGREKSERGDLEIKRQGLIEQLRIYQELQNQLDKEHELAQQQLDAVNRQLADATARQDAANNTLNELKACDVWQAARNDPRVQLLWDRTSRDLDEYGITADFDELRTTAIELTTQVTRAVTLRTAIEAGGWKRLLVMATPILAVVGVILLIEHGALRAVGGASLFAALGCAGRVTIWLEQRAANLRQALGHVEATMDTLDDARSRAATRVNAQIEIAERVVKNAEAELDDLEQRHASAGATVREVDRQLTELQAGARLQRFIAERSASSDYQRELGIVSIARRDFEDLTTALREAIEEHDAGRGDPPAVDRIVLYIDDLDRCTSERVVEVLEAVHLLLAMDLFVVVVGVDPRWLVRSLRQRFHGSPDDNSNRDEDGEYWQWTPQNYLEKIFQIPFVLPAMSSTGYEALLKSLSIPNRHRRPQQPANGGIDAAERGFTERGTDEPTTEEPSARIFPARRTATRPTDTDAMTFEDGSTVAAITAGTRPVGDPTPTTNRTPSPTITDLTTPEVRLLGALAPLVRTPRIAKRMVNIYRMLRNTRDLGPASEFLAGDFQAVCQLISLLTGYPDIFGQTVWGNPGTESSHCGMLYRPEDDPWSSFVDNLQPVLEEGGTWTNTVSASIAPSAVNEWDSVVTALATVRSSLTVSDSLAPYQRWAPRIARFSFELSPFLTGRPQDTRRRPLVVPELATTHPTPSDT